MLTRKERDIAAHLQTASWGGAGFRGWYYTPGGNTRRFCTDTLGRGLQEGKQGAETQILDTTQFHAQSTATFRRKLLRILASTPRGEGK